MTLSNSCFPLMATFNSRVAAASSGGGGGGGGGSGESLHYLLTELTSVTWRPVSCSRRRCPPAQLLGGLPPNPRELVLASVPGANFVMSKAEDKVMPLTTNRRNPASRRIRQKEKAACTRAPRRTSTSSWSWRRPLLPTPSSCRTGPRRPFLRCSPSRRPSCTYSTTLRLPRVLSQALMSPLFRLLKRGSSRSRWMACSLWTALPFPRL